MWTKWEISQHICFWGSKLTIWRIKGAWPKLLSYGLYVNIASEKCPKHHIWHLDLIIKITNIFVESILLLGRRLGETNPWCWFPLCFHRLEALLSFNVLIRRDVPYKVNCTCRLVLALRIKRTDGVKITFQYVNNEKNC